MKENDTNQCVVCRNQSQEMPMTFGFALSMVDYGTINIEIHGQILCEDCARAICISSIAGVSFFDPDWYRVIREKFSAPFVKKMKDNDVSRRTTNG